MPRQPLKLVKPPPVDLATLRLPFSVLVANRKGGCAKSTLTVHAAWAAQEAGLRVLVLCADTLGDSFKRLGAPYASLDDCAPYEWASGCWVSFTPDAYAYPEPAKLAAYDIIIVDTPGSGKGLPDGPPVAEVIVPITDRGAAEAAVETLADVQAMVPLPSVIVVPVNKGCAPADDFRANVLAIRKHLPAMATIYGTTIPYSHGVWRTDSTHRPAWLDEQYGAECAALHTLSKNIAFRARRWCETQDLMMRRQAIIDAAYGDTTTARKQHAG